MFQDVVVPAGGELKFEIDDAAKDGIFGDSDAILYEIVLPDQNTNGEIVVVAGNGQFGTHREEDFRIPLVGENTAAYFRAANEDVVTDEYAAVAGPTAPFKIYIKFADYHEDAAWKVTSADGTKLYASKNANDYRYGNDVTEELELPVGQYKFTISDRKGTDEYRAFNFYQLSYLNRQQRSGIGDGETIVYKSDGLFEGESQSHAFEIPVTAVGGTTSSAPSADQGIVIGDMGFLEEAQEQLCAPAKNYCTKNSACCSNMCLGFRCQPNPEDVTAGTHSVASGGRDRATGGSYGGSAHRGGYSRA
eukprot:jgi/Psemu1/307203/fgenesh1_kg.311_\